MSKQTREEILESGVVHFSLGDEFGVRLMEIAQEHVLYSLNPEKGLAVLTEGLVGCPRDLALQILKGDMVCFVEDQQIMVSERTDENDSIFPKLNIKEWYIHKANQILESGDSLQRALRMQNMNMATRTVKYHKTFDFTEIIDFVYNGKTDMFDDIYDIDDVSDLVNLIKVTKDYIEQSLKVNAVIDWLRKTYPSEFVGEEEYIKDFIFYQNAVVNVSNKFNKLLTDNYSAAKQRISEFKELSSYLESVVEIDKVIKNGIEPVNILDNYSAGWLSPDGKFYGLRGKIANMLHNQIADALQEIGIIPNEVDDYGNMVNPDSWLEQQGWVKIHGENIQFAGCLNTHLGGKNVALTPIQIDMIYQYGQICCDGAIKLGWRQEYISAVKFRDFVTSDPEMINKKYFEF